MSILTLVGRSLRFYWRTHLAVALGVAVSAAVLVGALAVGDSVRYSLRRMALARLGQVELALAPQNRFFRAGLADDLTTKLNATVAPVLQLRGTAVVDGGAARANHVQVVGVDHRFWTLGGTKPLFAGKTPDEVVVNERLAEQLGLKSGDELLLRVEKPSLLARDAPLSTDEEATLALRLTVSAIAGDADFGRFSLQANQIPPYNAFVPLAALQAATDQHGKANMLLVGGAPDQDLKPETVDAALRRKWQLADANLELRELPGDLMVELRTERVFLDPPVAAAALDAAPYTYGFLTYFVNELRAGNRVTPYSMVTAAGSALLPPAMRDDEIVVNDWLASDLKIKPGDGLTLRYYIVGPMRQLEEKTARFRIRTIVPLRGLWADPTLMPPFPGIAEAQNCRDWEPGIDVDLGKIRPQDEAYWNRYRGTPKAFVTLQAGQRLWGNRFGNLTAIRYPADQSSRATLTQRIRQTLDPASLGLYFQPVRQQALAASAQGTDFGQLFLGLSFFLIAAALLLTALLFALGVEQRTQEVGTLLALGFTPGRVRRLLMLEALVLALLGSVAGAILGTLYTRAVLYGLSTVWQGAVGTSALHYYAEPTSIVTGIVSAVVTALQTIWIVVRKLARRPARELLSGGVPVWEDGRMGVWGHRWSLLLAGVAGAVALVLLVMTAQGDASRQSAACFTAGALLLIGSLALCYALLSAPFASLSPTLPPSHPPTLGTLGWR
ncbi:MAG: ABC transporter permease, partial [Armatimonadota bacterium]|nr:ABC transporter permease [Armatimonadota bacterium]